MSYRTFQLVGSAEYTAPSAHEYQSRSYAHSLPLGRAPRGRRHEPGGAPAQIRRRLLDDQRDCAEQYTSSALWIGAPGAGYPSGARKRHSRTRRSVASRRDAPNPCPARPRRPVAFMAPHASGGRTASASCHPARSVRTPANGGHITGISRRGGAPDDLTQPRGVDHWIKPLKHIAVWHNEGIAKPVQQGRPGKCRS